jgi:HAD superfamily hydrolase (TIGR01459 family)
MIIRTRISPTTSFSEPYNVYPSIASISENYNGILLDAYGVFWAGNATGLFPGAACAMKNLVNQGKCVGILTNASAPVQKEIDKLLAHGLIRGSHYHFLITSGEVMRTTLITKDLPFASPNRQYWLFGGPHPKFMASMAIFDGLPYVETKYIKDADFIYISVPHLHGEDQTDPEVFRPQVKELASSGLWMVCANPDRFAHEGNPPKPVVRQGSIAALYEEMGGKVLYIGKPYHKVYTQAMSEFKRFEISNPKDVLMVGDTPETDICGAKSFGMATALITQTGIFAERRHVMNEEYADLEENEIPDYFIERLASL